MVALSWVVAPSSAQDVLTYDSIASGRFAARSVYGIRPMNDGEHYTTVSNRGVVVRYRYVDGQAIDTIFNAKSQEPQIRIEEYQFSNDETMLIIRTNSESVFRHSKRSDYWIYDIFKDELYPLSTAGKQQEATLSPDGRKAAFVRGNNIFVVDLVTRTEKQITGDGIVGEIINGSPDWVYEEEFGFSRGYEWSPSSSEIAFFRFDERRVKPFSTPLYGSGEAYPKTLDFKYPKAGEENSVVQIKVYDVNTSSTLIMDIGTEMDQYIPLIQWTPRNNELAIHRMNRLQNRYDMLFANSTNGTSKVIYSESNPRYVERIDQDKVTFLADGKRFIVKNENDGWMHLYLYDMNGRMIHQITRGAWEVTSINAIDIKKNQLYYTSTESSPLGRDLYVVNFGSIANKVISGKRRLTNGDGYYGASFSKGNKYYIRTFSNVNTPTVVTLHSTARKQMIRTLEDNVKLRQRIERFEMPVKEFFSFTTPDGDVLNGYTIKPRDFDPTKRYPIFMTQYSGPGSQSVANSWGVSWEWALVKDGYVVACVDGRGTGFRGEEFRKCTYGDLGAKELEDQIYAAKYLAGLSWVDDSRIGIYGWSYGGFMALNCILQGADVFKAAIAVAPVTSWRFYDTIYTELYNGLPGANPEGYDDNSPVNHADKLTGKLLIVHGTADDNVHVQNSYLMIDKLLAAGKDFDMLIYPDQNHGIGDYRNHLMRRCIAFINTNL